MENKLPPVQLQLPLYTLRPALSAQPTSGPLLPLPCSFRASGLLRVHRSTVTTFLLQRHKMATTCQTSYGWLPSKGATILCAC